MRRLGWTWLLVPALAYAQAPVVVLEVDGPIGPATRDFVQRGIGRAAAQGAALIVVELNTPGGLELAMRDMVQDIIGSTVPIAIYVTPPGARAASAGTYLLYAAHVAAMAPATSAGAATPVVLGGFGDILDHGQEPDKPATVPRDEKKARHGKTAATDHEDTATPAPDTALDRKLVNDAVAHIRGLAELRGRNAEWAERAVREGASVPANEALALGVIDMVADDRTKLLQALHGRTVTVLGAERRLRTAGAPLVILKPDWRNRLLALLTNPNVAYLLMLLGVYGLIFELMSSGHVLPGVVGAICLLQALYALQVMPVNYAGLALIGLGLAFIVAEAYVPSFGALGIGGIAGLVFGSLILFDTEVPGFTVSRPLVGTVAGLTGLVFLAIAAQAFKIHRRPVVTGVEQIIGSVAVALKAFDANGRVRLLGEIWSASATVLISRSQRVRVTELHGLTLWVEPLREEA